MSIYDHRDKPAYRPLNIEIQYSNNIHILRWWFPKHDEILASQIFSWHWVWYWKITDEIVKKTSPTILEYWKKSDPLCAKVAWYNVIMYFSVARAKQLGLTMMVRQPQRKICLLCNNEFIEDSLPMPLIERLGIDKLDFCALCLKDKVLQGTGNDLASEKNIVKYLKGLANVIGRVPQQSFGEGITDLLDLKSEERLALLKILQGKPSVKRVKIVFGSWNYNLRVSGYKDRKKFYLKCANTLRKFCKENGIEYHIKIKGQEFEEFKNTEIFK